MGERVADSAEFSRGERDDFSEVYEDFKRLRLLLSENEDSLKIRKRRLPTDDNIDDIFGRILSAVEEAEVAFKYVEERAHEFDLNETTKANGHWSTLRFFKTLIRETRKAVVKRENASFFNKENYLREIQTVSEAFFTVTSSVIICKQMMLKSESGRLLLKRPEEGKDLLHEFGRFNQFAIYDRFNAKQFTGEMSLVIQLISRILTAYGEFYYGDGHTMRAFWRSLKMILDGQSRAVRLVMISQYASPSFFKSFMSLTEKGPLAFFARCLDSIMLPVSVNKLIMLSTSESLRVETLSDGDFAEIPAPSSHLGVCPLPVRLISKTRRLGMEPQREQDSRPPSDELVLHVHGGGFICHTSLSHLGYLRSWTTQLDCPVISIDYSLSPEGPHPRPLEEVLFAYCWALKNPSVLGWNGRKIVLAGDSAGGLLITGVLIKAIELNIRLPDGALMIYTPFLVTPIPSPGRFLVLFDPIISMGFMACSSKCYINRKDLLKRHNALEDKLKVDVACLKKIVAEGRTKAKNTVNEAQNDLEFEIKRDAFNPIPFCMDDFNDAPTDPLLSPLLASDDVVRKFPPISLLTADYDPFIDDNVDFAKRLKRLGVPFELKVLEGLNHAFLNLTLLSGDARKGSRECCRFIREHFDRQNNE